MNDMKMLAEKYRPQLFDPEFNKIWNLSVYGAHLVKDTVKDTSVNVRSPGKKSHKRYI